MTPTEAQVPVRVWLPWLVGLAAIWGCSFLFIAVGVRELHPVYVTLGRVTSGALAVLVIMRFAGHRMPRDPMTWLHLAVPGVLIAFAFTLFGYGEQDIPSLLAGIWNGTTPLFTLPFAVWLFRTERFSTAVDMTNALRDLARNATTKLATTVAAPKSTVQAEPTQKASEALPQKRGFNALFVVLPLLAVAFLAGGFFQRRPVTKKLLCRPCSVYYGRSGWGTVLQRQQLEVAKIQTPRAIVG